MRRQQLSLLILSVTLLCTFMLIFWETEEKSVPARIAVVERADVQQVVALAGRLTYADLQYMYADDYGKVVDVYVQEGQRLSAGEAIVRLSGTAKEQLIPVLSAQAEYMDRILPNIDGQTSRLETAVRVRSDCTVRRVFVEKNTTVTAGMPVAQVSSNEQKINCDVVMIDAEKVKPGMWAWISADGVALGKAVVESIEEPQADPITGRVTANMILVPQQHIELPEGAALEVDIYLAGSTDVLTLPMEAITERETVWWVCEGRCTEIPAEIVLADEMRAWVRLPEGILVAIGEFTEGQRIVEADE